MSARVIDGKAVAAAVRERVKVDVAAYEEEAGRTPGLATVLVGDDPASEIYVSNKRRTTEEVGMRSIHHGLDASIREEELLELVRELGEDDDVDGILVQLPLPAHLDPDAVVQALDPRKDVDGLTPVNAGLLAHGTPGLVPCTPAGVMELLAHEGVELEEGLCGDVDYEAAAEVAAAITPVPGGVGPMTIAMLLANTLRAARMRNAAG